jgi:ElaB/YqjD/DUF883 family membrane-anchored ribosome-binding protein
MSSAAGQTVVRLKNFAAGTAGDAGSHISNALGSFAGQLVDGVRDWRWKAKTAARTTDGFVRSSPWQAAGAIAVAGVAAGILVSWSMRRARRRAVLDADEARVDGVSEVSGG